MSQNSKRCIGGPNGHKDELAVIGSWSVAILAGRPTGVVGYME